MRVQFLLIFLLLFNSCSESKKIEVFEVDLLENIEKYIPIQKVNNYTINNEYCGKNKKYSCLNIYNSSNIFNNKNFDLVTYFTVKNMEIDEGSGEVIAHGILTSRYGKHGFESNPTSYRLSFEFSGGYLRLKEFNQVVSDKEKKEGKQEPKGALVK